MIRAMAEIDIKFGLKNILSKIDAAAATRNQEFQYTQPVLVAVSKTKPVESVISAYNCGQRHFGENYVKELIEKGNDPELLEKCKDIKWHFIGHLQKNKINKVLATPNVHLIETVDSAKLADSLNLAWPKFSENRKLNVMIQVNTSAEEAKNGIEPKDTVDLAKHILENCPNLHLEGLMTIGKYGYNPEDGPNPDFICLRDCRDEVSKNLNIDWKELHLSMGMSTDFEQAIQLGSTIVRVGTAIFGARAPKQTS